MHTPPPLTSPPPSTHVTSAHAALHSAGPASAPDSPAADEALLDPYFAGLHNPAREPLAEPISKLEYEFEKRRLTSDEVRDLIYREVLEYHPQVRTTRLCA